MNFFIFLLSLVFLTLKGSSLFATEENKAFFTPNTKVELVLKQDIKSFGDNFSGVAYVPSIDHYFILDDSCEIYEVIIDEKGIIPVRTIPLIGFKDCEAIVHLPAESKPGSLRLAVTEERIGTVAFFDVKGPVPMIKREQARVFHVDEMTSFWRRNAGLEAMAVDGSFADHPIFYFGKEEFPRRIYRGVFNKKGQLAVSPVWDAEKRLAKGSDIAELYFLDDALFVLDQRGGNIVEVNDDTGEILSGFKLPPSGWNKYEGLSIIRSSEGEYEMVIVAERHRVLLYKIQQQVSE